MTISAHHGAVAQLRMQHGVTVAHLQMAACHLIVVAYFLSFWKYKTWYVATAGAMTIGTAAWTFNDARLETTMCGEHASA